jgi:hypothetical protein
MLELRPSKVNSDIRFESGHDSKELEEQIYQERVKKEEANIRWVVL